MDNNKLAAVIAKVTNLLNMREMQHYGHALITDDALVEIVDDLKAIDASTNEQISVEGEYYEPAEGNIIRRIYRNGSWLEDTKLGTRSRYSWPDVVDIE